ncbi:hypothetical protein DES45_107112 [Microvirga subterranea]|uniref:Uncharacterized protein n=2 Tax=Microvirga subterranea TaxID=186651 RepID=A0A370HH04_9HYPH|nr:hypothetical protein DES45_107112 [Microvirga subterranea]
MPPVSWEPGHGMTAALVSLPAYEASLAELEEARLELAGARNRLMALRETLDQALEQAYRQQSFGPLEHLFRQEETALAACEALAARLAGAEERWCLMRAALALERALAAPGALPRHRLH